MHIGMYINIKSTIQNFKCSRHPILYCGLYIHIISQGEGSPVAAGHLEDFALLVHQPAVTLASVGCG